MAGTVDSARLPPADLQVRLQQDVLLRDGGQVVMGGAPYRLLRLTAAGACAVALWRDGAPVGEGPVRVLARRLLDAGLLVSDPGDLAVPVEDLVVVVPTHGRPTELERCLASVAAAAPGVAMLVVDDASPDSAAIAAVAARHGARIVRLPTCRGPSAARNTGIAGTQQPLIAFLDSDVVVEAHCLGRLAAHFADPVVGAAAPRVRAQEAARGPLAGYEERHSSLDMGPSAASVGPGGRVPYVPTTALVVRRQAIPGGFDEELHVGEDVDFVWRMRAAGHRIAYDPSAIVRHRHRTRPVAFARRRYAYATSIGTLSRRHPAALPAMTADDEALAIFAFLIARRPWPAVAALMVRGARLHRQLRGRTSRPILLAAELTARGLVNAGLAAAQATRRVWAPLALAAGIRRPRAAAAVLLGAHAVGLLQRDRPRLRDLPLRAVDDTIAAVGTWHACARHRTVRPLLPAVNRRGRGRGR